MLLRFYSACMYYISGSFATKLWHVHSSCLLFLSYSYCNHILNSNRCFMNMECYSNLRLVMLAFFVWVIKLPFRQHRNEENLPVSIKIVTSETDLRVHLSPCQSTSLECLPLIFDFEIFLEYNHARNNVSCSNLERRLLRRELVYLYFFSSCNIPKQNLYQVEFDFTTTC